MLGAQDLGCQVILNPGGVLLGTLCLKTPDSDHKLIWKELNELSVSKKDLQSGGSPEPGLITTEEAYLISWCLVSLLVNK